MRPCLILVDLQNDYFPGGKMRLVDIDRATDNARRLLSAFREKNLPLIHIQHISTRPGATFFLPDTRGVAIEDRVVPLAGEAVVVKHFPNGFRGTVLQEELHRAEAGDLVICGAMSHMCIDATTRAAADAGYACRVAEDACATRNLTFKERTIPAGDVHAAFMAALAAAYATVATARDIVGSLP